MLILRINTREAVGRTLAEPVTVEKRKLFSKGHAMNDADLETLSRYGVSQVQVVQLQKGEVSERDAVQQVLEKIICGNFDARIASDGRANLNTIEPSCLLVDSDGLARFNSNGAVFAATRLNFSYHLPGDTVVTLKSLPFCVGEASLSNVLRGLEESGSLLQVRPIREPKVAVIYTDHQDGSKAREQFSPIIGRRLEAYGVRNVSDCYCAEAIRPFKIQLSRMLNWNPTVVLVASAIAPSGPQDPVGLAMSQLGIAIENYMAPVEPGALLMFGYKGDVPVIAAPGCFRSLRPNVLDLILPPVLARYRISRSDVASLGHGGLMK